MRAGGIFEMEENPDLSRAIDSLLTREIERGEMPSASWLVTRSGRVVSKGARGFAVVDPERIEATGDTIYDLASLTKPLATTTLVLRAAAEGLFALDDPVQYCVKELESNEALSGASWRDLLAHRAGLAAWYPLFVEGRDRQSYLRSILSRPPAYEPRTSATYSDLGFILLFIAIERAWHEPFDRLVRAKILEPLGVDGIEVRPSLDRRTRIAATDRGNQAERAMVRELNLQFAEWREDVIWGEVNDANAHYLGGVSGHAGLFGDTSSVAKLAAVYLDGGALLDETMRKEALACQAESQSERRGLGWQLRTDANPGAPLSRSAFGHTGFTGTSVWIDPERDAIIVLLTNRIHPTVKESRIQEIRRELNRLVVEAYL